MSFLFNTSAKELLKETVSDRNSSYEEYIKNIDQLIQKTDDEDECDDIIEFIVRKLNLNFIKWKKIYKTLKVVEHLIKGGSQKFIYQMMYHKELIENLTRFKYDVNGAENIREKAKTIYLILDSNKRLEEERKKYKLEREKEAKEEERLEGGLLNSIGTFKFGAKENDKKYDLTQIGKKNNDNDNDSDSDSSSSSDEEEKRKKEREKRYMKKDNKKKEKQSNPKPIQDLFSFDEPSTGINQNKSNQVDNLFDFTSQTNNVNNTQNTTTSNNNGVDLINMNDFLNTNQDQSVKMINLMHGLSTIQNKEVNNNAMNNNSQGFSQPQQQTQSQNINLIEF